MFQSKIEKAVTAADKLLERRAKLQAAIDAEVSELSVEIDQRIAAEAAVAAADVALAVGEPADLKGAQKSLEGAQARITRRSQRLAALRGQLNAQGGDLGTCHDAWSAAIPEHAETVKTAFRREWEAETKARSHLLAKRAALELLVGKMTLPDPVPADVPVDLEGVAEPFSVGKRLLDSIGDVVGWRRLAESPSTFGGRAPMPYDPGRIYITGEGARGFGLIPGTKIVDASMPPGIVRRIVEGGDAVEYRPGEGQAGVDAAQQAQLRIAAAERERAAQALADSDGTRADWRVHSEEFLKFGNQPDRNAPFVTGDKITV